MQGGSPSVGDLKSDVLMAPDLGNILAGGAALSFNVAPATLAANADVTRVNALQGLNASSAGLEFTVVGNKVAASQAEYDALYGINRSSASLPSNSVYDPMALSDSLYLPGPIPISRNNFGAASLTINGGLNAFNSIVNSGLNLLGAVTEPVDRFQGELITLESNFGPGGGLAAGATSLLAATSRAIRGARMLDLASEGTAAGKTGVYFFDKEVLPYINRSDATLGQTGQAQFFMPLEDSAVVVDAASAYRYSGGAPSLERAYGAGGEVFGVEFPIAGMSPRLPLSTDTTLEHFLEGGNTALRLPNGGGYLVNPTREFVVPGGSPIPSGSVLFKIDPDGTRVPIRNW